MRYCPRCTRRCDSREGVLLAIHFYTDIDVLGVLSTVKSTLEPVVGKLIEFAKSILGPAAGKLGEVAKSVLGSAAGKLIETIKSLLM